MASVAHVIHQLEGMLGVFTGANTNPPQAVATWVELMKAVMRQPGLRDQTDWQLAGSTADLDESEQTATSGVTMYGMLGIVKGANDDVIFSFYNAANPTVASTNLNASGTLAGSFVVRNASATADTYGGAVYPQGIACSTALTYAASERDEGTLGANEAQAFVVFRTN